MALPRVSNELSTKEALKYLETSPETIRLNFCEDTPVHKLIFKLTPDTPIRITKISYSIGSNDLSANGYVSVIISRVDNPNVWGVAQVNSQIIFQKIVGGNNIDNGDINYFNQIVVGQYEPIYVYVISNLPVGVKTLGQILIDYIPLPM
jgi:hypothetical protein